MAYNILYIVFNFKCQGNGQQLKNSPVFCYTIFAFTLAKWCQPFVHHTDAPLWPTNKTHTERLQNTLQNT